MDCTQIGETLDLYLDGELEPALAAGIEAHLSACPECAARVRAQGRVRERISALVGEEVAPPALRERVQALVRGSQPEAIELQPGAELEQLEYSVEDLGPAPVQEVAPRRRPAGTWRAALGRRNLQFGLALAASLAALLLIWTLGSRGGAASVWAAGLADDHGGHHGASGQEYLVSESDPEALGRWFEERLGTTIPLPETPAGSRLVGGQICFVNGYRVAHAIYQVLGVGDEGVGEPALGEEIPGSAATLDPQARTVSYYVLPRIAGPDDLAEGEVADLNFVAWDSPPGGVFVLGARPATELASFHPVIGREGQSPES